MNAPAIRSLPKLRIPIATLAVSGLGFLVALAAGTTLYIGIQSGLINTRALMTERANDLTRSIQHRVDNRLRPVEAQARWFRRRLEAAPGLIDAPERFGPMVAGALGSMPQVAGIGVITPDAIIRRWSEASVTPIIEDWSSRPEIVAWIKASTVARPAGWMTPFWTRTLHKTVLSFETPLYQAGTLVALFVQVIPVSWISQDFATLREESGFTPFLLYGRANVLAHPNLADWQPQANGAIEHPLKRLDELDDPVLKRIWQPDDDRLMLIDKPAPGTGFVRIEHSGQSHLVLYRTLESYGPENWHVGVHGESSTAGLMVGRRLALAAGAGLVIVALAVVLAMLGGRRLSRSLQQLAAAARDVESRPLAEVREVPSSAVREIDEAAEAFTYMIAGLKERELIRSTLGRFVPPSVAASLLARDGEIASIQTEATVLFSDIARFTSITETLGGQGVVDLLNAYFTDMVEIIEAHGGVVTQFQGDAILATFNVPVADPAHARQAILAAELMERTVRSKIYLGLRIQHRIGIATGAVVAGAVGAAGRQSYTVHGDAVNAAARLEELNKARGTTVLIAAETARLALATGEPLPLMALGQAELRGQSERTEVYTLASAAAAAASS